MFEQDRLDKFNYNHGGQKYRLFGYFNKDTQPHSFEFTNEFKEYSKKHNGDLEFSVTVIDIRLYTNEKFINNHTKLLTQFEYYTNRYPGIFICEGDVNPYDDIIYYRNYEMYDGKNFKKLTDGLLERIRSGEAKPLCFSSYKCMWMNFVNQEWLEHKYG